MVPRVTTWRQQLALATGLVVSGVFLWLAVRQVDAQSLVMAFGTLHPAWVAVCAITTAVGILLRGMRWRVVAGFARLEQPHFTRATNLGVLTNLIFPGRAGEFVRVITLANLAQCALPGPLASAVVDRLIDVLVLTVCGACLYWALPASMAIGRWLTVLGLIGAMAALMVAVLARNTTFSAALVARFTRRWLHRWPLQPAVFITDLGHEFRAAMARQPSLKLLLLATLILGTDYAAIAVLLHAFNLSLPLAAPLLLWVCLAAGSALPSAPGYVGVYQAASVWALGVFAVSPATAVALVTVLQLSTLLVAIAMAGPGAIEILRHARARR